MLTWRLWRQINRPTPLTALYHHLNLRRAFVERAEFSLGALAVFKSLVLILLPVLFIFLGVPLLFISYTTLLPFTALVVPLAITVYGFAHCVSVSGQIVRERELANYDLLGVSPPGRIGLHWAYTVGWLVSHRAFRWMLLIFIAVGMFAALLGLTGNFFVIRTPASNETPLNLIRLLGPAANIASYWLDYVQTVIISSLIAMYIGALTNQATTARLLSGGIFLLMQVAVFVVSLALSLLLHGAFLYPSRIFTPIYEYEIGVALFALLSLIVTYVIRETIIRVLWGTVVRTLNASPSELDTLIHRKL